MGGPDGHVGQKNGIWLICNKLSGEFAKDAESCNVRVGVREVVQISIDSNVDYACNDDNWSANRIGAKARHFRGSWGIGGWMRTSFKGSRHFSMYLRADAPSRMGYLEDAIYHINILPLGLLLPNLLIYFYKTFKSFNNLPKY